MNKPLIALFAAALVGGCATTAETTAPAAEKEEVVYRTGSNIPSRQKADPDGVKTYDREALDRARSSTSPVPRAGIPGSGPGN